MLRAYLEEKYRVISKTLGIIESADGERINTIIKKEIQKFMKTHSEVAIFGNGEHTHMLTLDYIYELKKVQFIIDNAKKENEYGGYKIIRDNELELYGINGVIISSNKYRGEMVGIIQNNHSGIDYLDLYEKFEEQGIHLSTTYYNFWHPSNHYWEISRLRGEIERTNDYEKKENLYLQLLKKYIEIKDFRLASICAGQMSEIYDKEEYHKIKNDIKELYKMELQAAEEIDKNNVLMLCVDGLRRKDYIGGMLPNIKTYCNENMTFFTNAYACSTSTYESLVPAYSENDNLQTKYFESNEVEENECRFICEAKNQGRNVCFYTDAAAFIKSDSIRRKRSFLTAAEKFWYFILDAAEEKNGLFYIHIGYESHFPYVNPYTNNLTTGGTHIMFDYLPRLGGKIRTNYIEQQQNALHYLDDLLTPLIKRLDIRMVIFADHGNILLKQDEKLADICATKFSYHEDLIQIPLLIKSPEQGSGENSNLVSLISMNDIIICLLNKKKFFINYKEYIKTERSLLYNPDFQYIYNLAKKERELQAYEAFVFVQGYKLIIYHDGTTIVVLTSNDKEIDDNVNKQQLINKVKKDITVLDN